MALDFACLCSQSLGLTPVAIIESPNSDFRESSTPKVNQPKPAVPQCPGYHNFYLFTRLGDQTLLKKPFWWLKLAKFGPEIWQLFQVESHQKLVVFKKKKLITESHFDNSAGKNVNSRKRVNLNKVNNFSAISWIMI